MNSYGLILAGGIGSRCGSDIPKQYIEVDGKPIFIFTAEAMQRSELLKGICVVCAEEWKDYVINKCKEYDINLLTIGNGGATGLDSIWNGLAALGSYGLHDDDVLVIQDANRPFIDSEDINKGIKLCKEKGCSIAAVEQVCDQVKLSENEMQLLQRNDLFELQRPEFHTVQNLKHCEKLCKTQNFISQNPACILLENQENIEIFESKSLPVKVTYPTDLEIFLAVLSWRNVKHKDSILK